MGERKAIIIILLILSITVVSISEMKIAQSESSSDVSLNDEHYVVNTVMGGFGGNVSLCSFNATKGCWIELELSSSSSGAFKVFLDILSVNHGIIFSDTGKNFSETVYLDYEDTYEITISKSPFYSSVRVRGSISVFHQETSGQSSSGNWVEVTRFEGASMNPSETESFTCNHNEWRIVWSYEPIPDVTNNMTGIDFSVIEEGTSDDSFILSKGYYGAWNRNGTEYIHDKQGTFHLLIVSHTQSFTIIIEQNLDSEGNWVEVKNLVGNGAMFGYTSPFDIDHIEWRIRWEYTPLNDFGPQNDFIFSVVPEENKLNGEFHSNMGIASVSRPIEQNGTLHFNNLSGRFYLHFAPGAINWKIIIEQNLDSIPEFPSWIILPVFLTATLFVIIFKKKVFRSIQD